MSASLRLKLMVGFVLVFVAGLAAGAFIGAVHSHHRRWDLGRHHSLAGRMKARLQSRLDLTPEQVAKTTPIIEEAARQLEQIRSETGHRVHDALAQADHALAPTLTPEQRARLLEMGAQRESQLSDVTRQGPAKP